MIGTDPDILIPGNNYFKILRKKMCLKLKEFSQALLNIYESKDFFCLLLCWMGYIVLFTQVLTMYNLMF
jgi:hypothetical protein